MASVIVTEQDWQLRLAIYQFFVAHGGPPTPAQMAQQFGSTESEARASFLRLSAAHALFLEPGTDMVRMASPLSGVPTPYLVRAAGHDIPLFANCAWDALGIPAMLHADARITAHDTLTGELIAYAITGGQLVAEPGLVVHFAAPFRHWYDDLIHT